MTARIETSKLDGSIGINKGRYHAKVPVDSELGYTSADQLMSDLKEAYPFLGKNPVNDVKGEAAYLLRSRIERAKFEETEAEMQDNRTLVSKINNF